MPTFFWPETMPTNLQTDIEKRLADTQPDVEVLLVEPAGPGTLRITIDHPDGVSLDLCEAVTGELADVRERFALEVSSPGTRRPLTRPEHFRRFTGRRARLRLGEEHEGRRSYTGEITAAGPSEVTVAGDEGVVSIPYSDIQRANLIEE